MSKPKYAVVDRFDSPVYLDTATTNIPASTSNTLQVISSLAQDVTRLRIQNGVGSAFIGVYKGPSGSETLVAITGPFGFYELDCDIPSGYRVSLRSMKTSAISSGELVIEFLA